jgi:hypothetical protein
LKRRKSMTQSKNSEFFWYSINLYCEKTKKKYINEEEDKTVDEGKWHKQKLRTRRKKRKRRSKQSNINENLSTKTKHYGHIQRVRLRMMSKVNFIKY